jgi:UDP-N-acetylglucosamine 2-epimerase (non-hydrolysing)
MLQVLCVCGARPNFMKIAPLVEALSRIPSVKTSLVHTGQHYDERMSQFFFDDLRIPPPNVNLDVGSGSHAVQTAEIMKRFEPVCQEFAPDWVVVVGDVNSTIACALVAAKLQIKVAHVEAGLRSFDRTMPEEVNRVLTDAISDLLFVSEPSGVENLRREGIAQDKVHLVGNVMIDTLLKCRERASSSPILADLRISPRAYAAVTLHRPSTVDEKPALSRIMNALQTIGRDMPVVFPVHPRSRKNIEAMGLAPANSAVRLIDPLGYLDFLRLMSDAAVVLTDSGGIQEETTILGVPCLTVRENTERPITVEQGTNRLTGNRTEDILRAYREVRESPPRGQAPELWDGRASERIARILTRGSPADRGSDARP